MIMIKIMITIKISSEVVDCYFICVIFSAAFNKVVSEFGGLDVLFNNAGITMPPGRVIEINLVRCGPVAILLNSLWPLHGDIDLSQH